MARLTFPSDRLVYQESAYQGSVFTSGVGLAATVYSDAAGTTLADVQNFDGSANAAATFTVDSTSRLPLWLGPASGADTLYVKVGTGPVTAVYAVTSGDISAAVGTEVANRAAADSAHVAASDPHGDRAAAAADATTKANSAQAAAIAASAQRASNLSDLASATTARTNLGLGTAATQASSAFDASGAAATAQTAAQSFATSAIATQHTADNASYLAIAPVPSGDGTGATDRAALQALIDAMPATGGYVELLPVNPLGVGYIFDPTSLNVNKPCKFVGQGGQLLDDAATSPPRAVTTISSGSATATAINVTARGCTFEDFAVINTSGIAPSAGAGMAFSGPAGQFTMTKVTVHGFYDDVTVDNGWFYKLNRCNFYDPQRYGVYQRTSLATYVDHAAAHVTDCTFAMLKGAWNPSAAYRWEGGGGVRWTSNQIVGQNEPGTAGVGSFQVGIDIDNKAASSTVELTVVGGAISNVTVAAIRTTGEAAAFSRINVTGVAMQAAGATATALLLAGATGSNGQVHSVTVTGCTFVSFATGINAYNMTGLTVGPNTWLGMNNARLVVFSGTTDNNGNQTAQLQMSPQNFGLSGGVLPTNCLILRDKRAILGAVSGGTIDLRYTVPFNTNSIGTWVTLFSFKPASGQGSTRSAGRVTVDATGYDVSNGTFHSYILQGYINDNGVLTIPAASQSFTISNIAPHVAYQWDTTSSPGYVKLQVQLTAGGTQIAGKVSVDVRGWLGEFGIGDISAIT